MRMIGSMRLIVFVLLVLGAMPAARAQDAASLQKRIEVQLNAASPGTRFGVVVTDPDGRELIAINPEGRFIPASNTKMFTTAAAFMTLSGLDQPDVDGGTTVALQGKDVILKGFGDARMSSATDCTVDCLATLADAVAAKTKRVRNIIGDATLSCTSMRFCNDAASCARAAGIAPSTKRTNAISLILPIMRTCILGRNRRS